MSLDFFFQYSNIKKTDIAGYLIESSSDVQKKKCEGSKRVLIVCWALDIIFTKETKKNLKVFWIT
jgi:hypothetical protein